MSMAQRKLRYGDNLWNATMGNQQPSPKVSKSFKSQSHIIVTMGFIYLLKSPSGKWSDNKYRR